MTNKTTKDEILEIITSYSFGARNLERLHILQTPMVEKQCNETHVCQWHEDIENEVKRLEGEIGYYISEAFKNGATLEEVHNATQNGIKKALACI